MTNIVVAGGAGFLGANLIRELLKDPSNTVVSLDNYVSGSFDNLKGIRNIRLAVEPVDIRDEGDVIHVLNSFPIDQIYNLACPASPLAYQKNPLATWETSLLGTRNLLHVARLRSARFVQASTSEVYGDPRMSPQRESYWGNVNPVGLRACYDEGKRAAETYIADSVRVHGLDARIARIFNTYGPWMATDDGRVISNFIVAALTGQPMQIYGRGFQTRSFCYVDDTIRGLIALMNAEKAVGIYNIGNPQEMTILEIADMIDSVLETQTPRHFTPLPQDDPHRRCPDIHRAFSELRWYPMILLQDGLIATAEWLRGKL